MKTNWNAGYGAAVWLALSAAGWGFGTVMIKSVLHSVPPITLLLIQLLASLSVLWLMIAAWRIPVRLGRDTLRLGLLGLLNPGLAYVLNLLGLSRTTASMSTLIWAAEPIVIVAIAWLALRERVTPALAVCAVIGAAGVVLVAGVSPDPGQAGFLAGNLLTGAGLLCCSAHSVITRRLIHRVHPLLFLALQQSTAALLVLALWPVELRQSGLALLAGIPPIAWAWAAASGVVYYALAYWFYLTGLQKMPVSRASLFFNLIPIFGVAAAYLFLGERLGLIQWIGAFLIIVTMLGVIRLQFAKPDLSGPVSDLVLDTHRQSSI